MAIKYKQKCYRCKKNYVTATHKQRYVLCYDCYKKEFNGEIKDPKMKKLFGIPEKYYENNEFLRSVKLNYLRFENISENQIEAFKKTVEKLKKNKPTS